MKKIYTVLTLVFLVLSGLTLDSCKKDKNTGSSTANCDELLNAFTQAQNEYIMDLQNQQKCEKYVQAFKDYVDNCGTFLTPQERQQYQDAVDQADCSN